MSKQIFTIPARQNQADKKLKVAAYCRVSTEHEEQRQSLKSQVVYYMQKICDNPDWDFAGIYAEIFINQSEILHMNENDCTAVWLNRCCRMLISHGKAGFIQTAGQRISDRIFFKLFLVCVFKQDTKDHLVNKYTANISNQQHHG